MDKGTCQICTLNDNDMRVFLVVQPLIVNWSIHVLEVCCNDSEVESGDHNLRVEYFESKDLCRPITGRIQEFACSGHPSLGNSHRLPLICDSPVWLLVGQDVGYNRQASLLFNPKRLVMLAKITAILCIVPLFETAARAITPATVIEAAAKLDLETLPLPDGAKLAGHRRVAELSYTITKPTKAVLGFVDKQLTDCGWQQMPGLQEYGESASADYQLDGYVVHLSVIPQGPGVAFVVLMHQGNVSLVDFPVPTNAEKLYAFTSTVMYKSPDSVAETAQACRERLLAAGWTPYGGAGDTAYYRQNAVRADVNVMSAPGQGGATVISFTSTLLSLELPAPAFADDFRYTDGTTAISFDTDKTPQEVANFYRRELGPGCWRATTDEPVEIEWKEYTIFRNAGQEMITIATHEFEGRTRVRLDHQNASEVAEEVLRKNIAVGEKAKYRDVDWLPVEVIIPDGLQVEKLEDWALKIPTPRKDSFAIADAIGKSLLAAGWITAPKKVDHSVIRSLRFDGQDRVLYLMAIKPPKFEPWVALVGVGGVKLHPVESQGE